MLDALPAFVLLFSFGEFFSDMMLVLRVFVLLTIISFIYMHLGKGPLAIVLIIGVSYFVLFGGFWFFGSAYVLMMLLSFGVAGIFIDFFFVFPGFLGSSGQTPEAKMSSMGGVLSRMRTFGPKRPAGPGGSRVPPPM